MSSSGKVSFIHVGNQTVSQLGPIFSSLKSRAIVVVVGWTRPQSRNEGLCGISQYAADCKVYLQWYDEVTGQADCSC